MGNEEVVTNLQSMLNRFNMKRDLHQRTQSYYKNRDMKIFTIPLMMVQLMNAILPQLFSINEELETHEVLTSALAAISAIWLGFQAKKRYTELSESHKNAASIYQHLAVLTMVEKKKANMMDDYDKETFFQFHDEVQNLEGKAKDEEFLIPYKIRRQRAEDREKDELKKKTLIGKQEEENIIAGNAGINIPAIPAITDGKSYHVLP